MSEPPDPTQPPPPPPPGGVPQWSGSQWAPPPPPLPPDHGRRPIRRARVLAGVGAALGGHLLTAVVLLVGMIGNQGDIVSTGFGVMLVGQAVLLVACLAVGIVLTVRGEGGFGVGLIIGWAIGVVVLPVVGFGLCVWALNSASGW